MIRAIIVPVVGGIIGYITNDLAIKMLFRPRNPVYIGKYHVPFTPGLIPSQKERIANSIGALISDQLLNSETLRASLLSPGSVETLQRKVQEILRQYESDRRTVREALEGRYPENVIEQSKDQMERKLTQALCRQLAGIDLGTALMDSVLQNLRNLAGQSVLLSSLISKELTEGLKGTFSARINEYIARQSPDAVFKIVDNYGTAFLDTRLCDLYAKYKDKEPVLIEKGTELYVTLLDQNLDQLLRAMGIKEIVAGKISSFDAAQLEAMIFGIMKKELKAIVYLGAILGFFMGFINLII